MLAKPLPIAVAPTADHIELARSVGSCVYVVPESRSTVGGIVPLNVTLFPDASVAVMSSIGIVKSYIFPSLMEDVKLMATRLPQYFSVSIPPNRTEPEIVASKFV